MRIEPRCCSELDLGDAYLAAFGVGPDQELCLLECLGPKDDSWFDRKNKCDWRARSVDVDGSQCVYLIRNQIRNYNLIQPLPDGLLLAGSRCEFAGDETAPNGHVFDLEGRLLRRILLGDGIQKIHATKNGDTWVSYFDEGVFGNLGWNHPIGTSGLIRFDKEGNRSYDFQPIAGLESIVDCYALNVTSAHDAWCYYYTQFSVVQIQDDRVLHHWTCPVSGASEMAVWRDLVAMPGGYGSTSWDVLRLLPNGRAEQTEVLEFVDNSGRTLEPSAATCRGDAIWFVQKGKVYRTALRDLRL